MTPGEGMGPLKRNAKCRNAACLSLFLVVCSAPLRAAPASSSRQRVAVFADRSAPKLTVGYGQTRQLPSGLVAGQVVVGQMRSRQVEALPSDFPHSLHLRCDCHRPRSPVVRRLRGHGEAGCEHDHHAAPSLCAVHERRRCRAVTPRRWYRRSRAARRGRVYQPRGSTRGSRCGVRTG